jgi:hypothetical protein
MMGSFVFQHDVNAFLDPIHINSVNLFNLFVIKICLIFIFHDVSDLIERYVDLTRINGRRGKLSACGIL